ncbi:MAG: type II toxin-antitoxin system RelE/ParE family toxin [Pseudomonadota bacterium]
MTLGVVLRPRARSDLSDIWDYTATAWSPDQANTYLRALNRTFEVLADFPEIARLRTEFEPPVRIHRFRSHVIIYQSGPQVLDVIRVVHAKANWAGFLSE